MTYAIVKPGLAGFGTILALGTHAEMSKTVGIGQILVQIPDNYPYRLTIGDRDALPFESYRNPGGAYTHIACKVDTYGT